MGQKKADTEYPFEHGEVIIYALDGVSIQPVTTKIQASFLTLLPERRETAQGFHHEANGDFKTINCFNVTIGLMVKSLSVSLPLRQLR